MRACIRSLIWLGLVLWVGGLLFFIAVVAPVAFGAVLPMFADPALGLKVAGTVVRLSLIHLHDIGLVSGVVLLALAIIERAAWPSRRSILPQLMLLAAMLGLTAWSQFGVIPRMDALRAAAGRTMGDPAAVSPAKTEFNRLHHRSTELESGVLLSGLALIVLYSRQESAAAVA